MGKTDLFSSLSTFVALQAMKNQSLTRANFLIKQCIDCHACIQKYDTSWLVQWLLYSRTVLMETFLRAEANENFLFLFFCHRNLILASSVYQSLLAALGITRDGVTLLSTIFLIRCFQKFALITKISFSRYTHINSIHFERILKFYENAIQIWIMESHDSN